MNLLTRLNTFLVRIIDYSIVIFMGGLVVLVFFQVINRFIINVPAPWTEEMARYAFVWLSLLASVKAVKANAHISVDMFINYLPRKIERVVNILTYILILVFFAIMIGTGIIWVFSNLNSFCDTVRISRALIYSIVPISGFLMLIFLLEHMINHIKNMMVRKEC